MSGCGAPTQGLDLEGIDVARETIIHGTVTSDGAGLRGAYVRLLDGTGEFTAEVVTSDQGEFRFFAAPGDWTLRALSPKGNAETRVTAESGTAKLAYGSLGMMFFGIAVNMSSDL